MPTRTSYAQGTPSWVDLATSDVAAARSFYGQLFGWEYEENPTGPDGGVYVMATKGGANAAGIMDLSPEMAAGGVPPMWSTYLAVDDLDATASKVEGAGGQVMMPPMDVMEAGRMALVVEPSGAVVGLWQAADHIGAEVVNEHGALIWNELLSPDVPAAAAFYDAVLGMGTETVDMPMGPYTIFTADGEQVAGAMAPPMEGVPAHWAVYFAVDDCDAAVAKVQELGGACFAEPMDIPPGRMAGLSDPQGAMFFVLQPAGEVS